MPRIYTKTGDDGSTGLLYGGRISKGDLATDAYGTTDEAVAALGLARSLCEDPDLRDGHPGPAAGAVRGGRRPGRQPEAKRKKLDAGVSLVTDEMVAAARAAGSTTWWSSIRSPRSSSCRARTRRARRSIWHGAWSGAPNAAWSRWKRRSATVNPEVRRYLNRLSDLIFVLARRQAGEAEPASRAD